ncbi:hypothetical protein BD779DRAFT_1537232 [Infundibulicybe gibba]|nr:hypothetical protein BD779DRAFT_1537232 [Infundibulicybe gibba]
MFNIPFSRRIHLYSLLFMQLRWNLACFLPPAVRGLKPIKNTPSTGHSCVVLRLYNLQCACVGWAGFQLDALQSCPAPKPRFSIFSFEHVGGDR